MTIYIESFLIQHILINFCLLRLVNITLKSKTTFFRLILSSIVGALFSVISTIILTNQLLINILKLLCAISMLLIAFKQTKKMFLSNFILLFLFTYALGGAISSMGSHTQYTTFGIITYSEINLNVITISIIILTYIFELLCKNLKSRMMLNSYIFTTTLTLNNRKLTINAYMDTGNFLNLDGKPVIIVDLDVYLKLSKISLIDYYLSKSQVISTGTVTGNNNLKVFTIDEIKIKLKKETITLKNQYIAVNSGQGFKNTNYQALLSPMIL